MTDTKIKGVSKEEIMATFADAINQKYVKGDPGIIGLEGRTPMHVQETKPTDSISELGDLWYKDSTVQLFVKGSEGWVEIAEKGEIGLEGVPGPIGPKPVAGKDYPIPKDGKPGEPGKAGKDADMSFARSVASVEAADAVKAHENKANHDPFLIGTKTLNEAGMKKGDFIQYDGDKLIYSTIQQVAKKVSNLGNRGMSLPAQSTKTNRLLQTNGTHPFWGMKITVSATQPTSPVALDLWLDIS